MVVLASNTNVTGLDEALGVNVAPDHPAKVHPAAGVAVRLITVFVPKLPTSELATGPCTR